MSRYETTACGAAIVACVEWLADGADVSVLGGERTHEGAVTLAEADGSTQSLRRNHHRDDVISVSWARALADRWKVPVCVRCGIHYDHATQAEIREVIAACEQLMTSVLDGETPTACNERKVTK